MTPGDDGLRGEAALDEEDEVWLDLKETITSPDYKPPMLPPVALELLNLSGRPDVELAELIALLERDPILAASVLKLSRSPLYAGRMEVTTLKAAVVRLGLGTLRSVVLEAAVNLRIFRAEGYSEALERLRLHSTMTAHLCRLIAPLCRLEPESAFLAGLLHDVGAAACLIVLGERRRAPRRGVSTPRPEVDLERVWPMVDRLHQEVGGALVTRWQLPGDLHIVLRNHHGLLVGGKVHPMAALITLAEEAAIGLGHAEPMPSGASIEPLRLQMAYDFLQLNEAQRAQLQAISDSIRSLAS